MGPRPLGTLSAVTTARDAKLAALSEAVSAYEAEFGEITGDEMAARERSDREAAIVVRGT